MGKILLKLLQTNCYKMRKRLKVSGISITSIYSKTSCRNQEADHQRDDQQQQYVLVLGVGFDVCDD